MEITIFRCLLVSGGKMVLYGFSGFFARPLLETSFGVEENDPRVFVVCSQVGLFHCSILLLYADRVVLFFCKTNKLGFVHNQRICKE